MSAAPCPLHTILSRNLVLTGPRSPRHQMGDDVFGHGAFWPEAVIGFCESGGLVQHT
jgi:hypothetical protein